MQRAGCDPENMQAADFICDFCLKHWAEDRPMVEGHKGSLICGPCLTLAYRLVMVENTGIRVPDPVTCATCLQHKEEPHWQSTAVEAAPVICQWCIKRSATMLEKDKESGWKKPGPAA